MRNVMVGTVALMVAVMIFVPLQELAPRADYILVVAMIASFSQYVISYMVVRRFGFERVVNPILRWVVSWGGVYGMTGYWLLCWLAIWWFGPGQEVATGLLIINGGLLLNNVVALRALSEEHQAVSR